MAKSVLERCDLVVGQAEGADFFVAVSSYKVGEGEAKETRYAFGAYLKHPAEFMVDSNLGKASRLWHKRDTSASNAGLKGKMLAGEITAEDAAAEIMSYNGEEFLVRLNETKVRESAGERVDTVETQIIRNLTDLLRDKFAAGGIATAKVAVPRADNPPMTEKGKPNFNAWAKIVRAEKHPWAAKMEELTLKEIERKKAAKEKQFD